MWANPGCSGDVIKANNGNIFGDSIIHIFSSSQRTDRNRVAGSEHGCGWVWQGQQGGDGAPSALDRPIPFHHVFSWNGQSRLFHGSLKGSMTAYGHWIFVTGTNHCDAL